MANPPLPASIIKLFGQPRIISRYGSIGVPVDDRYISAALKKALGGDYTVFIVPANTKTQNKMQAAFERPLAKTVGS